MKFLKRLKSGNFWISMISAVVLILQAVFNIEIKTEYLNQIILGILGILVMSGIVSESPSEEITIKQTDISSILDNIGDKICNALSVDSLAKVDAKTPAESSIADKGGLTKSQNQVDADGAMPIQSSQNLFQSNENAQPIVMGQPALGGGDACSANAFNSLAIFGQTASTSVAAQLEQVAEVGVTQPIQRERSVLPNLGEQVISNDMILQPQQTAEFVASQPMAQPEGSIFPNQGEQVTANYNISTQPQQEITDTL